MIEADVSFGAWGASRRKALDLTREQLTECVGQHLQLLGRRHGVV